MKSKKSAFFLCCFLLLLCLFIFSRLIIREQEPVTITISAAQSLKDVIEEVVALYKEKNSNINVVVNLGGSGSLQRQIEQGAPVDLFISASLDNMDQLKEKGLLYKDSYWNLLKNCLVLVVPKGFLEINSFEDLLLDQVKTIALGEPSSVPAGKYAMEALSSMGLDGIVKEKAVYAKDVKEVATWVESENAQAGMVYMTDALVANGLRVVAEAPLESHSPIVYPVGIIKEGQVKEAERLVKFLYSEEVADLFQKYGFTTISGVSYGF